MATSPIGADQIEENWNKYCMWFEKTGERAEICKNIVEHFGERLASAPASSKKSFHNCFTGGLVDHSLRVLQNAVTLSKSFNFKIAPASLIICTLFHDLGKVGDLENDYYVEQTSDWHRDKLGELYTINDNLPQMETSDRSMWLLQHFGLKLSMEEWIAIKASDGSIVEANRKYSLHPSQLVMVVHHADYIATQFEKW
jgi:HD superfamily phosphohydrolase YqeK